MGAATRDRRRSLGDRLDVTRAAQALAGGAVVAHGFANLYALTARAGEASVQAVNRLKGRPVDQVGSITVPPGRIEALFDWSRLPAGHTRAGIMTVVDSFLDLGPFGFRGPAAPALPGHLTSAGTTQVIVPGYACPSNDFLAEAIERAGDDHLYITSANRSRHLTGADDTPAHWRAEGVRADFGDRVHLLEHPDETAARAAYPRHLPMSTTILGFHEPGFHEPGFREPGLHKSGLHEPGEVSSRRPRLVLERHGSLGVDVVRETLDELGLDLVIGPRARKRLALRTYD